MVNSLLSSAMWRTQEVLHGKNTAALPGLLLFVASILLVYRHMTEEVWESNRLKTFLALILIQMMPLAFLEMKILSCADPVGLLCKFGSHVLLMHVSFLSFRLGCSAIHEVGYSWLNVTHLVLGLVALHIFGFRWNLRTIFEHRNVLCLSLLAMVAAYSQEYISAQLASSYRGSVIKRSITSGSDYIEILAFVPAVWMVHKEDKNAPHVTVENSETKRKVVSVFAYLIFIYSFEDVMQAYRLFNTSYHLASLGHMIHFLMVLDLSFFVLAHIFNPEKFLDIKTWVCDRLYNGV